MNWRALKYTLPLLMYGAAWSTFSFNGIIIWIPLLLAFGLIPLLEVLISPSTQNLNAAEEEFAKEDVVYDWLLYLTIPLQYVSLFWFFHSMHSSSLSAMDRIGRIGTMGLLCGVVGIDVGHELGHRISKSEQWLARCLLLTSLNLRFFIEHNRGHHKYVGTPIDPGTARFGEPLYRFWFRSMAGVYRMAWRIALHEQKKQQKSLLQNEMLHYELIQIAFCTLIGIFLGFKILGLFLLCALIGILLLESVNYIEHYGLIRKSFEGGKYERTMPRHSWNSNHVIGRLLLFELSRHSDHHYLASRKYQLLRHHDDSPQLPAGYPASLLMALVPPVWFAIMNRKIRQLA